MDKKQETVWAIFSGKIMLPFLIKRTRKEAQEALIETFSHKTWEDCVKAGYSVKKMRIQIAESD